MLGPNPEEARDWPTREADHVGPRIFAMSKALVRDKRHWFGWRFRYIHPLKPHDLK